MTESDSLNDQLENMDGIGDLNGSVVVRYIYIYMCCKFFMTLVCYSFLVPISSCVSWLVDVGGSTPWTDLVDLVWEPPGHELIDVCDAYVCNSRNRVKRTSLH